VHNVGDVRQIEVHAAEQLVRGHSLLEDEIVFAKLKNYTSPSSDEIPAERIQAVHQTVHQLFIVFKKAYDSVRREVLYSILIEFEVP
jgi:hypothetical protein